MKGNRVSLRARSVFTKLLVVLFVAGILINIVVFGFITALFRSSESLPFHKDIVHYVSLLAKEVGDPPDFEKARAIAGRTSFQIRYEGSDRSWATAAPLMPLERYRISVSRPAPGIKIGVYRGRHALILERKKGRLIFESSRPFIAGLVKTHHVVMLSLSLLGLTTLAWLSLRWVLRPLRWLSQGVQAVAGGDLRHKVPESRRDELGALSIAFNSMTDRIRSMLASHEQLLLDVSHELRSPLTRMNVSLEFFPDSKTKESLQQDVREIEHLVTEILEAARLRAPGATLHRAEVDIAELITSVAGPYMTHSPGVKITALPDNLHAQVDKDLIVIVLRNLITNAIKYSEGSTLPVEVSAAAEQDRFSISITDFGEGISPDDLPHIFEPFYRVDKSRTRSTGGYGLGLNLCKAIIDAHEGEIHVESAPGKGTTVIIYLSLTRTSRNQKPATKALRHEG